MVMKVGDGSQAELLKRGSLKLADHQTIWGTLVTLLLPLDIVPSATERLPNVSGQGGH